MRRALTMTERMACVACVALGALAGCHDLPDLGFCGNGVIEAANGEACDDGVETATCTASCQLLCTSEAVAEAYVPVGQDDDGAALYCPGDRYRCGLDGICRAPSSTFEHPGPALPFDITGAPVLGDVDNDGLPDLVGTSQTNLYVRFAAVGSGALEDLIVQAAPSSDAPYAIFDLDPLRPGPMQPDVMIAVPTEGIAFLRSDGEGFTPNLDLSLPLDEKLTGTVLRDPDPALGDVPIAIGTESLPGTAKIKVRRVGEPALVEQDLPDCEGAVGQGWFTRAFRAAPDQRSFVVVTQRGPLSATNLPWHVCRYTHGAGGTWDLDDFELPQPAPTSVALANIDGDPCQELLVFRAGAGLGMIDAVGPTCAFAPGPAPVPVPVAGPGAAEQVLAGGPLVPGGVDELLLADGVYGACVDPIDCSGAAPGTFVRRVKSTQGKWNDAVIVDLNGDGVADAVASHVNAADVDVVRGGAAVNVYRADTSDRITAMVAGDFDGDRLGDVAMVESSPPGDRLVVLYGTHEATVEEPAPMSRISGTLEISRFTRIPWFPSQRGTDNIDDLLVLDTEQNAAGIMVGDAARLMTTPRLLPQDGMMPAPPVPMILPPLVGVAAGSFGSSAIELLVVSQQAVRIFNIDNNEWAPEIMFPPGMNEALQPPIGSLRNGMDSRVAAISNAARTEVVVFSVRGGFSSCKGAVTANPLELRGLDIDGDGQDEVVVRYQTAGGDHGVQVLRADTCAPETQLNGLLTDCVDIVGIGDRLLAVCRDGAGGGGGARTLYKLVRSGDAFTREAVAVDIDGDVNFLTASDFDGDGVLDVALGVRRAGGLAVEMLRQCPAHDTRTCEQ